MTLDDALDETADTISREIAEHWREEALQTLREMGNELDYDTSEIEASFTPVVQDEDGYSFRVNHPLATLYEYGSDPHTIEPKDPDGVLAFEQDGETVFAKSVSHPGTEALLFISTSQQSITEGSAQRLLRQFSDP